MNTGRELLEKAAKAAGIELDWDVPPKSPPWRMSGVGEDKGPAAQWNPITDDGDALRLAVQLRMMVCVREDGFINAGNANRMLIVNIGDQDPLAATRRAIVRAAAEIGRAMP
jgi:hypothetical protein